MNKEKQILAKGRIEKFSARRVKGDNNTWYDLVPSVDTPLPLDEDGTLHSVTFHVSGFHCDNDYIVDKNGRHYTQWEFLERLRIYNNFKFSSFDITPTATFEAGEEIPFRIVTGVYTGNYGNDTFSLFDENSNVIIELDLTKLCWNEKLIKQENKVTEPIDYFGINPSYASLLDDSYFNVYLKVDVVYKNPKEITYLTPSETASALGVTVDCLRKWDESGRLKPDMVTEGGHRRYEASKIKEISKQNEDVSMLCKEGKFDKCEKNERFTNGEMIWLNKHFTEYPDMVEIEFNDGGLEYARPSCAVLYNERNRELINKGMNVIEEFFKNHPEKYNSVYLEDFKIAWRICCLNNHYTNKYITEYGECNSIINNLAKLLRKYNFNPIFEAYNTNHTKHDYSIYHNMMLDIRDEVIANINIYVDEESKQKLTKLNEDWKQEIINRFENDDYDEITIKYGDIIIDFYINTFSPNNFMNIEIKDEEIFNKMVDYFSKYRRKTHTIRDYTFYNKNISCIDDYLRDWFC